MIIVKLIGGLGNQMFQYATARSLAEKHSTILKLDVAGFEDYKLHRYSLHCFNIWEHLATQTEVSTLISASANQNPLMSKLKNLVKYQPIWQNNVYLCKEKYFHFDPVVLDAPQNSYLDGYWQSERYFVNIKDILIREFSIKYPQDARSREISKAIAETESVSIHIRRADYVENEVTYKIHGACTLDYYYRCLDLLMDKIKNPHFFIFSDDHQWVKANLKLDYPMTLVDHNNASKNYEDLRLMSQCKHNIIANSTFSWWAAWLNQNPHKIIYAPQQWFTETTRDTKDLIPQTWNKV